VLVFASDLHLRDSAKRSSFSVDAFARSVEEVVRSARDDGIPHIHLILLGDIFELLKSTKWLEANTRPWEECTRAHAATVQSIVQSVFEQNADFFAALDKLRRDYSIRVSYVPGNHDRPLNGKMGDGCRILLREKLGQTAGDDRYFEEIFQDPEHRVFARHGHRWDPSNRYLSGSSAVGDFIVIDVLARLPLVLAQHLRTDVDDKQLYFAHELDDVIPQTTHEMARWLAEGIGSLTRLRGPAAMRLALGDIAEELEKRMRGWRVESTLGAWWVRALKGAVPVLNRVDLVRLTRLLTSPQAPAPPQLSEEAKADLTGRKRELDYVVFGHTHIPEYRTIVSRQTHWYLNCGAWRRVHRRADSTSGQATGFVTTNLGALAIIRSPDEARATKCPRHELRYSLYA
jgi:UDP-2,3-diacylglucosamine pyrophosphatase LpxH